MGKSVTVKELFKDFKSGTPMVLESMDVPKFNLANNQGSYGPYKFKSKDVIITNIQDYYGDKVSAYQVRYVPKDGKVEEAVIVPPSFLLNNPTKLKEKVLVRKYQEYLKLNFNKQLHFNWTIGADPEIFAVDDKGVIVPAFHFLGSKDKPGMAWPNRSWANPYLKDSKQAPDNELYWDGFQAEFTCNIPGTCMDGLGTRIKNGLWGIDQMLKKHNPKAKLSIKTVMDIPFELLRDSAPEHVAFGCRKSLNVYGMSGKDLPGTEVNFRPAGGHMHFGCGNKQPKEKIEGMIKALDAILGVACVSLFAKFDDPRRRELYGLAGEYRLPEHGLEYRTLSNAWLCHPLIAHMVFDLGRSAMMMSFNGFMKYWKHDEKEVVEIINTCDVKRARRYLRRNKAVLLQILNARYHMPDKANFCYQAIMKGMETIIADPDDIFKNWRLDVNNHMVRVHEAVNNHAGKKV